MTDDVVTRLHRCLLDALQRRDGSVAQGPLKVAEIYEDLVPYQAVRSELGVDLNADYEHALLRLLAGEGGLLRLEPDEAREELRREVESPYPSVGMFRTFSTCDVWLASVPAEPSDAAPPAPNGDGGDGARGTAAGLAAEEPATPAATAADDCCFCGGVLPAGRSVRFCPFCGGDQRQLPCPRCSEVLEWGWRFCIGCGAEVSPD